MPFYLRFLHIFAPVAAPVCVSRSRLGRELMLALTVKFALLGALWFYFVREQPPSDEQSMQARFFDPSYSNQISAP